MITNFYKFINEHLNSIKSSEQAVHARTMNEPHLSAISGTHHAGQHGAIMQTCPWLKKKLALSSRV